MPRYTLPHHISGGDRRTVDVLPRLQEADASTRRLFLDSRDASTYAPFEFSFKLGADMTRQPYDNISSIELKAATIPKVAGENYVILDIAELRDSNIDSSCPALHDGFAVCYFDNSGLSPGDVKVSDKIFCQKALFNPPKSLDKLTVRLLKHDGTVVSTSETGGVEDVSILLSLTLEP
jgi:hypothetical protein